MLELTIDGIKTATTEGPLFLSQRDLSRTCVVASVETCGLARGDESVAQAISVERSYPWFKATRSPTRISAF